MKKAMELSVLCNCRIGLILFDGNERLHDFTTEDMRTLVGDYFAKEVYETNTKEELYRRYHAREAVQAAANQVLIYEDRKPEVLSGDAEKTDETLVEVESNSDANNLNISRASSAQTGPKTEVRRKTRSSAQSTICESVPPTSIGVSRVRRVRVLGPTGQATHRLSTARPCGGWSSFAAQPASYVQGSTFSSALDHGSAYNYSRSFKEEPYSAGQQILRIEDSPPFLMSVPRAENDGVYGVPVPSLGQECAQRPETMFLPNNNVPTSCSVCVLNPEARKILEQYESAKHHLPPTLMQSPAGRMISGAAPHEMQSLPSHHFPFLDYLGDNRPHHLGSLQQFSVENNFAQNVISDVQQDAMCLQNLFRPPGNNSYNFPSSSHNSQT